MNIADLNRSKLELASINRIDSLSRLAEGSHIHIIGVSGAGTAQLAILLKSQGFYVSGSDKAFYPPSGPLVKENIDIVYEGFSASNLNPEPTWVVVGNAVGASNPEVLELQSRNIPFSSMPETIAAFLIGDRDYSATSIVVAGTHGKTTTSSGVAELLDSAGLAPGFFIGGVPNSFSSGIRQVDLSRSAKERIVVLEGDEYDSAFFAKWPKFHSYRPDILIITSLDFDHGDIYASIEEIEAEFSLLAKRLPQKGYILVSDNSTRLKVLSESWRSDPDIKATIEYYGESETSKYRILQRKVSEKKQKLSLDLNGVEVKTEINLIGKHNAYNLTAAASVATLVGLQSEDIENSLSNIQGVKRRQSVLVETEKVVLIDDFAHHPVEVAATLNAVKEAYPNRRLIAVFEPRSNTSRRNYFQDDYAESFEVADKVIIKEVLDASGYSKTTEAVVKLDVPQIVKDINLIHEKALSFLETNDIFNAIIESYKSGDIITVMSNGSFDNLTARLKSWGSSL